MYSPVSGKVIEVNDALSDEPGKVSHSRQAAGPVAYSGVLILWPRIHGLPLLILMKFTCHQVNTDAFGDGWLMKVKMTNAKDLDALLDSSAYAKQCEE